MSVYRVTSRNPYRGYQRGETFEASLDERTEERAIDRGAIEVIERSTPQLIEGSYRLPKVRREVTGNA